MDRRDFLQAAALLVAGTAAPASWSLTEQQRVFLAAQPDFVDRRTPKLFSKAQRAAVAAASEQIIPATDTPGAIDAGVPRFIELMVQEWFTEQERDDFLAGLDDLLSRAGGDFAAVDTAAQLQVLEALEAEAGDSDWFNLGNTMRVWDSDAPFICQFKELTVLGFFLSEKGGTKVLRTNPMGSFDGDIPLEPGDAAYVAEMPMRLMLGG